MNIARMLRTGACALAVTIGAAALSSCTDYGGGYYGGPGVDVGVGFDYYDSPGYDYGGWGHGYRVGPGHSNYHWDHHDSHGHAPSHSYHAAPGGHGVPSLPSHGHGGGGGGGHGGPHH
jgi:hypothetical protein